MNRQGYSLLEAVVAMTIFAIGVLALSQSYFGVMRAQVGARNNEVAVQCARDRMEEIVNSVSYASISAETYPSEEYGDIDGGIQQYQHFARSVTIADSTNAAGVSVLKEVTVEVKWQTSNGEREINLNSAIARFKDLQP